MLCQKQGKEVIPIGGAPPEESDRASLFFDEGKAKIEQANKGIYRLLILLSHYENPM